MRYSPKDRWAARERLMRLIAVTTACRSLPEVTTAGPREDRP